MVSSNIEKRIERIANLPLKIDELLHNLPFEPGNITGNVLTRLKNLVLGDKEMLNLINGIKERRAPRFIMVGCTGAGKSALINAITSRYLAETGAVFACTANAKNFNYMENDQILFQIIDTRGIGESILQQEKKLSAEEELKETIKKFEPDAVLFVVAADVRAHIDQDVGTLQKISQMSEQKIPLIAIVTKADKLEPDQENDPLKYSQRKKENIAQAVSQVREILETQKMAYLDVLAVSAKIDWDRYPQDVPENEWPTLKIAGDYRYNIEKLVKLLASNIDIRAAVQLMLNYKVEYAAKSIAERIVKIFAGLSAGVGGAVVLPVADLPILCSLQVLLVLIIAYLSGKDADKVIALEFIAGLGLIGGAGYIMRAVVRQATKLLSIVPFIGIPVNATFAYSGTYSIGKAAIAYFFDGVSKDKLAAIIKAAEKESKKN